MGESQPCKGLGREHLGHRNCKCRRLEAGTSVVFPGAESRLTQSEPGGQIMGLVGLHLSNPFLWPSRGLEGCGLRSASRGSSRMASV